MPVRYADHVTEVHAIAKKAPTTELLRPAESVPALPDATIDELAQTIRRMHNVMGLQLAVAVGQLIVERIFGGDIKRMRANARKDNSLSRLAEHPDLPFSASTLSRNIAIYEVVERAGGLDAVRNLTHSHVRYVIGLPAPKQLELLKKADQKGWPVTKIAEEARKGKKKSGGGRPSLPRFVKAIHALEKYAGKDSDLLADLDAAGELEPEVAEALYRTVTGLKQRCEELQGRLKAHAL